MPCIQESPDRYPTERGVLEICFCIGLAIGIMVFYNHVGTKKITDDPTPIQVAMRKYEQDVDTTYIETSSRKGKSQESVNAFLNKEGRKRM